MKNSVDGAVHKNAAFPIKGFREGLLITLGDGDWEKVSEMLYEQIKDRAEFFQGAKIAIDVGERSLHAAEVSKLRDKLADHDVSLFALLSKSSATDAVAETLGLSTRKSVLKVSDNDLPRALYNGESALMIRKTLRSGTSVKYAGHVIVDGDVNPGAEIRASGSIYVWGKLRGNAFAGIDGSQEEIIAALEIESPNLSIANIFYQEQKIKIKIKRKAEKAYLEGNTIKIIDWEGYKRLE
jgi:septum site-determining protein MinC